MTGDDRHRNCERWLHCVSQTAPFAPCHGLRHTCVTQKRDDHNRQVCCDPALLGRAHLRACPQKAGGPNKTSIPETPQSRTSPSLGTGHVYRSHCASLKAHLHTFEMTMSHDPTPPDTPFTGREDVMEPSVLFSYR
uniref:Uncharacterized protein n=1 Tax=Eutreptiella gymnastica TaxID=73025 RepID=A0A7S4C9Y2_9EUGL